MKKINKLKEKGLKFDKNKEPLQLLPYESLKEIAKVLDFGAQKYGIYNWKKGIRYSRLIGAALRHIYKFNEGIDLDEETKTLHIANACANLMFLIWMYIHRKDLDDRDKNEF
jgi:hypothetical protein